MNYTLAPDVRDIAQDLIVNYHQHLMDVRIEYLFRDDIPKSRGKIEWGSARKVSGLSAFFAAVPRESDSLNYKLADETIDCNEAFFVITISFPIWQQLEEKQRRALVDHELSHCFVNEDDDLVLLGHDIEGFAAVVKRHGLWHQDLELFMEKSGQMALFARDTTI